VDFSSGFASTVSFAWKYAFLHHYAVSNSYTHVGKQLRAHSPHSSSIQITQAAHSDLM